MRELPAGSALERALRDHLRQVPPVNCSAEQTGAYLQQEYRVSKSLNVSPNYAAHFRSGIRELIQNWHDQCTVVAQSHGAMRVQDLTPAAAAAAGDVLLVCTTAQGQCCGYLALLAHGDSTCDVRLCNYASTISMGAMTLGESSKREQESLAGFFGEGVKVEINRIMASGASVVYYTSNQEWSFKYEKEHGGEVLNLHSTRVGSSAGGDTVVLVRGAQRDWFQRQNYLFLSAKDYARFGGAASKVELLTEPEQAGRVYVHGIYVMTEEDLPLCGLNYRGKGDELLSMGVGRDRNSVKAYSLVKFVPKLFLEYAYNPPKQLELATLLCVMLDKHPGSDWRSLRYTCDSDAEKAMADAMYHAFWKQHSQNAIPSASTDSSTDAEYLGVRTVKVSEVLHAILAKSQHHPSLDQLWERHYQKLLAIPDHVWREGDEADRYRYALILTLLSSFPKYLTPANVKVKALPAGNQRIIVAVRRAAGAAAKDAIYVVDLTALSLDEVHRRQKETDIFFDCDFANCACLPLALEDAAIAAITKVHGVSELRLRRELRKALHQHHGLGWRGEMAPPPQPPPLPHHAPHEQPEPMMVAPGSSGSQQQPSTAVQHPPGTPQQAPGRGATSSSGGSSSGAQGGTAAGGSSSGGGGQQPAQAGNGAVAGAGAAGEQHAQLLDDAALTAGVRGSLDPALGQQACKVRLERLAPAASDEPEAPAHPPPADCRESHGALVQSPILLGSGRHLFLREGIAPTSLSAAQMERIHSLHALLDGIHSRIFLQGAAGGGSLFYLYFDPTDGIIAFNLGKLGRTGEIWYNAAYDPTEGEPLSRATHWFLTACHELAHNFVRAHNSAFADVLAQIVLRYTPNFRYFFPLAA